MKPSKLPHTDMLSLEYLLQKSYHTYTQEQQDPTLSYWPNTQTQSNNVKFSQSNPFLLPNIFRINTQKYWHFTTKEAADTADVARRLQKTRNKEYLKNS